MMVKDADDDLFEEELDDTEEPLIHYDIATYPSDFTLAGIKQMWDDHDIEIPEYQREFVWDIRQASLLIDSFLIGLPVPPVFFYVDDENKNLVIDGQQRILSVVFFFEGYFGAESALGKRKVFRLEGLNEKSPYVGKRFVDLPEAAQRKLQTSVLRAVNVRQLNPKTDRTSVYHIFERLNTGGTPLQAQEIRNCVFRGNFIGHLKKMNSDANWRKIIGKVAPDKRQKDVELVLRVFALSGGRWHKYEKSMKEYLNRTMEKHRHADTKEVKDFEKKFPVVTKLIADSVGTKPFHPRGPLNSSYVDAITCTVLDNIDDIPEDFAQRFKRLVVDKNFVDFTYTGTTDTNVLRERFKLAQKYLID